MMLSLVEDVSSGEMKTCAQRGASVAICIGTFNQAQYLRGAIESASAQTYPITSILVGDDCSSDNTADVMKEICREHPQVQFFRQPKNLGLPGNLSSVLSKPETAFVVRLDSDDRLEPDYVSVLVELMCKYPRAGFAHCNVFELDEHDARARKRLLAPRPEFQSAEDALRSNATGFRVAANCILYRAEALKEANYYLPNVAWRYSEDWDLCLRMAINGWGNVHSNRFLSNYRVWADAQQVRATRKMSEVETTKFIYQERLEPQFRLRGWDTRVLHRSMRAKALEFVDAFDSPFFTAEERESYKSLLRQLGHSYRLELAMFLAEHGFNPALRTYMKLKLKVRDAVKSALWGRR